MVVDTPSACPVKLNEVKQSPAVNVQEVSIDEDDGAGFLATDAPGISLPRSFKLQSVDQRLEPPARFHNLIIQELSKPPELGILSQLQGTFRGDGFNTIFRPKSASSTVAAKLVKPINTGFVPNSKTPRPDIDLLQLNLTKETLAFSKSLGETPNRGLEAQGDIFLNGVPYVQTVIDVTNTDTGTADAIADPRNTIHFEPGMWMYVPGSTANTDKQLCRMACIPHGTTISATGSTETEITLNQAPDIFPSDITPLAGGKPPSQTAAIKNSSRLPQDLTKFIGNGTITQDMLDNPNSVLTKQNGWTGKTFIKTERFIVQATTFVDKNQAAPMNPEITNIPFLSGGGRVMDQGTPNAKVADVTAVFWISTVEYTLQIDAWKPTDKTPVLLRPVGAPAWAVVPQFSVTPTAAITSKKTAKVRATQLQYSQRVTLRFGSGIDWPHVSVATLVPAEVQNVDISAFK